LSHVTAKIQKGAKHEVDPGIGDRIIKSSRENFTIGGAVVELPTVNAGRVRGEIPPGFISAVEAAKSVNSGKANPFATFFQAEKGVVKGWYDATTKTLGAFTGKSDFSTFVHESFHAWTDSRKAEHSATLEKHFGKLGTKEYYEGPARAFERYLRDGVAITEALKGVFSATKDHMGIYINIVYMNIKGSPIESKVHADVKNVFDEMFGGGKEDKSYN
jgi:hypothetical protein